MSRKEFWSPTNANDREAIARWLASHGYVMVAEDGAVKP